MSVCSPSSARRRGHRHGHRHHDRCGHRLGALVAALLGATGALTLVAPAPPASADGPATAPSAFTPLPPKRLLDTRDGTGGVGGHLAAAAKVTLTIVGQGGVPATGEVAVAFNLTAVNTDAAGFFTASPSGAARPEVSNLNVTAARQTVANLVVVALGTNGAVDLYSQTGGDLVVDIAGYWSAASAATAGRFQPLPPARVLDTREGNGAPQAIVGAEGQIDVQVAGRGGVPAAGASSVVLNVTATESVRAGFVSAWPSGTGRPVASILNLPGTGATVPNLVIVPLGSDGKVSLFTQSGTHLVADVAGYFTNATAPSSTDGLFVPLAPKRILDSRNADPIGRLWPDQRNDIGVVGAGGVPATGVGAAVLNLTGTEAANAGYVTAYPAVTQRPTASNLNLPGADATVANLAFVLLGNAGKISLYSQNGTHIIADVAGYFLGTPAAPTPGVPVEPPPLPAPPLQAPPTTTIRLPCNEGPTGAASRVDIHPSIGAMISANIAPTMSQAAFDQLAYSVAVWSGPTPAAIATQPDFFHFVDQVYAPGAVTADNLIQAIDVGYHEATHAAQRNGCLPTSVQFGHRWERVGFPQSEIHDDVIARIDALVTDPQVRDGAKHVAETYLAGVVGTEEFWEQLNEFNAYAFELEWERRIFEHPSMKTLLTSNPMNSEVVSAKMHQLARYLTRAEQDPARWAVVNNGYYPAVVADYWNMIVANWKPGSWTFGTAGKDIWTLAFGPDSAIIARYTGGAAGITAPPVPPVGT